VAKSIADLAVKMSLDTKGLTSGLSETGKDLSKFAQSKALGAAGGGGSLGGIAMNAAGPIGMVVAGILAVTGAMISLASAASPALAAQLDDAWNDLYVSLGTAFIPVLEEVIPLVRLFGDTIATLAPYIKDFMKGFMALPKLVIGALGDAAKDAGFKSSVGAAGRQASFTSADAFAEKAYTAAFSGPGGSVQDQQLDVLKEIRDGLKDTDYGGSNGGGDFGLVKE